MADRGCGGRRSAGRRGPGVRPARRQRRGPPAPRSPAAFNGGREREGGLEGPMGNPLGPQRPARPAINGRPHALARGITAAASGGLAPAQSLGPAARERPLAPAAGGTVPGFRAA